MNSFNDFSRQSLWSRQSQNDDSFGQNWNQGGDDQRFDQQRFSPDEDDFNYGQKQPLYGRALRRHQLDDQEDFGFQSQFGNQRNQFSQQNQERPFGWQQQDQPFGRQQMQQFGRQQNQQQFGRQQRGGRQFNRGNKSQGQQFQSFGGGGGGGKQQSRWLNDNSSEFFNDDDGKQRRKNFSRGGRNMGRQQKEYGGRKRQRESTSEERWSKSQKGNPHDDWDDGSGDGGVFVIDDGFRRGGSNRRGMSSNRHGGNFSSGNSAAKKPPAQKFHCELCDVTCTSDVSFQDHTKGAKHQKNLKLKEAAASGVVPGGSTDENAGEKEKSLTENTPQETNESTLDYVELFKPSIMQKKLNDYPSPIIGLGYIVEYNSSDEGSEAKYSCDLCHVKCDPSSFLVHVTGSEHRLMYMLKHHKLDYDRLSDSKLSNDEFEVELIKAAEKVESLDGRGTMKVQQELEVGKSCEVGVPRRETDAEFAPEKTTADKHDGNSSSSTENGSGKNGKWAFKEQAYSNIMLPPPKLPEPPKWMEGSDEGKGGSNDDQTDYFTSDTYEGFDREEQKEVPEGPESESLEKKSSVKKEDSEKAEQKTEPDPFQDLLAEDAESLSFSKGNLGSLLTVLGKCVVKNEEDAQMALQVSNALTQALVKYRLQTMPPEVLSSNLSSSALQLLVGEKDAEPKEQPKGENESDLNDILHYSRFQRSRT